MENLTTEQWMEKYPYLRKMAEYTIFTTSDDINNLKNSEKVKVDDGEISIEILRRILNDSKYYEYAYNFFINETTDFIISHIIGGDTGITIHYKKSQIIKGIEKLILSNQLMLRPDEQHKYENLRKNISFEKFLEKNKGNYYNIDIDGNKYSIPIEQIMSLVQLSEEEFDKLCSNNEIKSINDIPKEYFIYASYKFFKEYKVFEEFMMPPVVLDRFNDIKSLQKIDLQAINRHLETEDSKFKNVELNKELENEIMSRIPQNASDLEKAVYIYIKMCKVLTYDDEYYAVNQKGIVAEKHKDVNYVSSIDLINNKVVCYEFNLIYSLLFTDFFKYDKRVKIDYFFHFLFL